MSVLAYVVAYALLLLMFASLGEGLEAGSTRTTLIIFGSAVAASVVAHFVRNDWKKLVERKEQS